MIGIDGGDRVSLDGRDARRLAGAGEERRSTGGRNCKRGHGGDRAAAARERRRTTGQRSADGLDELGAARVAVLGNLVERPREHRVERVRQPRAPLAHARRRRFEMPEDHRRLRRTGERRLAGEALEQDAAERVEIGAGVRAAGAQRLGRHVQRGPGDLARCGQLVVRGLLREAEVTQVHVIALRQECVGRLHVTVDEPALMGGVQRGGELRHQRERPLGRERPFGREQPLEVDAVDVAHGDVELAADVARLIDRDDARVVDRGRRARLPQEAGAERLVVAEPRRQDLQRDLATEPHVGRAVDHPHAAATEDRLDAVPPEVTADRFSPLLRHTGQSDPSRLCSRRPSQAPPDQVKRVSASGGASPPGRRPRRTRSTGHAARRAISSRVLPMPSRRQRSESPTTTAEAPAAAAIRASGPRSDEHRLGDDADAALERDRGARQQPAGVAACVAARAEQSQRSVAGEPGSHLDRGPVVLVSTERDEHRTVHERPVVRGSRHHDHVADRPRQHGLQVVANGAGAQRCVRRVEHQHGGVVLSGQAHGVGARVGGRERSDARVEAAEPSALRSAPRPATRVAEAIAVARPARRLATRPRHRAARRSAMTDAAPSSSARVRQREHRAARTRGRSVRRRGSDPAPGSAPRAPAARGRARSRSPRRADSAPSGTRRAPRPGGPRGRARA